MDAQQTSSKNKTRMMSDLYSFKKIMVKNDCRFNLVKQLL